MSEYWVSKKKYFCKYCDIYIADDAPSRQHHENGLRHKGNLERYIRGIYKAGEKKKKDLEEEKREMARVEQAANAAYAQDISLGHAKASTSSLPAASSAPRKPAQKPSNPFANYTTAAQLGFEDPDLERLEVRKTQGIIGEWEAVAPTITTSHSTSPVPEPDVKPELGADGNVVPGPDTDLLGKRPAEEAPSDDTRTFKLRKKTMAVGLGEIYDPGVIHIKLKKKEEDTSAAIVPPESTSTSTDAQRPKWTTISLKPQDSTTATTNSGESTTAPSDIDESTEKSSDKATKGWAKINWGQTIKEEAASLVPPPLLDGSTQSTEPMVKTEQNEPSTTGLFKKRKVGARGGRMRGVDGHLELDRPGEIPLQML